LFVQIVATKHSVHFFGVNPRAVEPKLKFQVPDKASVSGI